ncbi:MAG: dockerin type I repeat-containing protein [Oscillibacter sp.]|nr:dockerin type I repeat-containing protein [Oscillibacter sp.]
MKKRLIQLALILGLMTLTCVAAQATESDASSGLRNLSVVEAYRNDIVLTPLDASNRTARPDENDNYPGAVKVSLTYSNPQAGSEYLLIVLSDDNETPSVDNMAYIDQQTAASSATGTAALDFTIFPKRVDASVTSVTYSIYLSSNTDAGTGNGITGYEKVGSFDYYASGTSDVLLGDVDGDGEIMVGDAVLVLQAVVEAETLDARQTTAADVDRDGSVMVGDAVAILQYVVEAIHSFDELT